DAFGFIGCDDAVREDLLYMASRRRGTARELAARLRGVALRGGARGLAAAPGLLPRQRALVFLVSDFHLDDDLIEELFAALARPDVVPVGVWCEAQYARLPAWGIAEAFDLESRRRRLVLLRPGYRDRLANAYAARLDAISRICARFGREPFVVLDAFRAEA